MADTKDSILNAAERLFAERGYEATSLRAITTAAGVNLAAVHYHFGNKEGLLDAVVERRAMAMNQERLRELDELARTVRGGTLQVEDILRAFLLPGLRTFEREEPETLDLLMRLNARIGSEPPETVEELVRKHFGAVMKRFVEALQRALPELRPAVVQDRFRFAIGTLSHVFSGTFDLDVIPGHPASDTSDEEKIQHLIVFLAAGLRASGTSLGALDASPAACSRSAGMRRVARR